MVSLSSSILMKFHSDSQGLYMRISPSKLTTYLSCPKRYQFKYVLGFEEESGQAAINGSFVHEVLEHFYELEPAKRTLVNAFSFARQLDLCWEGIQYERCLELIWNLFDLEDPTTVNCKRTELDIELPWPEAGEGYSLKGIIDRIDIEPDGYVIVDYKSGKAPTKPEELDEKSLGIKFYSMLGLKAFGSLPVRVKLLYLGTPQVITWDVTPNLARAVEAKALAAVTEIENERFKAKPGLACRWCPFREICPDAKKPVDKKKKTK